MTNIDINTEVRNGAIAAIDTMRVIESIAKIGHWEWTNEDYFKSQELAITSSLLAAGNLPDRAKGVIMAMAEYIYMCNSAGTPNLDQWKPESAMTDDEKTASRKALYGEDEKESVIA